MQYGDVRHGGVLRGQLDDARLEIVRNGLVLCLSSLPEVLKNDFELYHERSEQSNKIENAGNCAEQLSKRLRRVDCFRRRSCERVIRKTPSLTENFRCFLNDFHVFFGKSSKSGGIIRNELGKAEPSVLENSA